MNYVYRFALSAIFVTTMPAFGMLPVYQTVKYNLSRIKLSTQKPLQEHSYHLNQPTFNKQFFTTIPNLSTLEMVLKHRYQKARVAILNRYVTDPTAFLAFEQAYINHINSHSFKEDHPDAMRDPELTPLLVECIDNYLDQSGINPNAVSLVVDKDSTESVLNASSPELKLNTYNSRDMLRTYQSNAPYKVLIKSFTTKKPAEIAFTPTILNHIYEGKIPPHLLNWFLNHEIMHIDQHHPLFSELLHAYNSVTKKGPYWVFNNAQNSIQNAVNSGIDLFEIKEYANYRKEMEMQADILPLLTNRSLAQELSPCLPTMHSRPALYLTKEELITGNDAILRLWDKESSSTRPIAPMYE